MRRRGWAVLAASLALGSVWIGRAAAEPKAGDEAPAFELAGSDGKTYKSTDFKGKQAVVIAWYPKAFTGG
jgi:peroxiredoxin Q/BCP